MDDYREVYRRLVSALDALARTTPHGRDYYLEPGRWEKAMAEHENRREFLVAVRDEIAQLALAVDAQR